MFSEWVVFVVEPWITKEKSTFHMPHTKEKNTSFKFTSNNFI